MRKSIFTLILFFLTSITVGFAQKAHHWETAVFKSDIWKYFVGTSNPGINTNPSWRALTYNDTGWLSGSGGFGWSDNDDGTTIPTCTSVYLRIKFNIPDTSQIILGALDMDYDDGFVAYINNVEIARANLGTVGVYPSFSTSATASHEATMYQNEGTGMPEQFVIEKKTLLQCIKPGINILAVEVHNYTKSSPSDLSSNVFLSFGIKNATTIFRSTPDWFIEPEIISPLDYTSSYLPLIVINTKNGATIVDEPKIEADMKIIHHGDTARNHLTDSANVYNGKIGIEIRGATSAGFPQIPYGLETRDSLGENLNVKLLGMPKENDWVLLSNWNDKVYMRNTLAGKIFEEMGHYAPRLKHCEVTINGAYRGLYLFGEKIKIDDNRVDIAKLKSTDLAGDSLTGGYIFKTDYDEGTGTYWTSNFSPANRPGALVYFVYHEPKANEIADEQKTYITSYVNAVETALYSSDFNNPVTGYRAYIDVNSFVDYWILEELSRNVDGYKKSRYFYKDKDSKDRRLHSGPIWDFDWAWKNMDDCYLYKNTTGEGWAYDINKCEDTDPIPPSWEYRMLQDPMFANAIHDRYFSLRASILSLDYMYHYIDSVASVLNEAQERHQSIYNTLGIGNGSPEIDDQPTTFEGDITKFKNWIATRIAWLDANMVGISTDDTALKSDFILRVFPNPVQEILYIESDQNISDIKLYNVAGLVMMDIKPNINSKALNIRQLPRGIYILHVTLDNGNKLAQKLIRQ
ncbi:MAG TPA: CotH kinase family protein [Paludibacteraceae bacterium]|nr:CotH kinase family protein [Paludibacteraceae bacterium]HPT43313.1 CotH kinase family protein [Paludibacteraceae bacterium]